MATLLVEEELYPAMAMGIVASKLANENRVMDEYILNECVYLNKRFKDSVRKFE